MSGQSHMREAIEELEEDCFMRGCPENLSDELKKVYSHSSDERADSIWKGMTYGEYYNQTLFVVNYGKYVKSRVKSGMQTRYRGYVSKYCLSEYEIGNTDDIFDWLTEDEYRALSDAERKKYTYYEWNTWDDWYGVYVELVRRVDCLLTFFKEWSFYHIDDADLDEKEPTADYVRLIVSCE